MLQIVTNFRTGETKLNEVPAPTLERGHLLIATRRTLVSQGTEKMLVQFGKASLFQKARSQPAKVRHVLDKIRTDGLLPTVEAVFRKLDEPMPLGYCNVGVVIGVGDGVMGFEVGDRVASNGPHAEVVSVPTNLVAKVPYNVSDDAGSFTIIGAIGLQGVRLAKPELAETFVVIGLGLIGQITAQLLQAHGCRVIGFDFDHTKVELASRFGVEAIMAGGEVDVVQHVLSRTGSVGCDGVIITASSKSNDVIAQAAQMSRKRGRIVLVGVVGLNINRADFYEKELSFQVSCSYGPGRYENTYEEKGLDYPLAFVRWTENRNFQAVLDAMSRGVLRVEELITRRVPLASFGQIYENMDAGGLASVLVYGDDAPAVMVGGGEESRNGREPFIVRPMVKPVTTLKISECLFTPSDVVIAVVGAGNFTKMTALPALVAVHSAIKTIVSAGGVSGTALAKKYSIPFSSTDFQAVLDDQEVKGVVITTRHNLHASQTISAIKAGKCVLVEKPLCLSAVELRQIEAVLDARGSGNGGWVSVGFNRRFSPHIEQMRKLLEASSSPVAVIATMNAGAIPLNHWVHDPEIGGGRLVGEACHFIDLAIFLTGSLVSEVSVVALGGASDSASILLRHVNGSSSVVNYLANGNRELSKERVEVHSDGRSLLLDNFRELRGLGFRSFSKLKIKHDKGHVRQFGLFVERVKLGGGPPIPWSEVANSARATLAIPLAIARRQWVRVEDI